jgi:hypothetical protein
VTVAVAMLTASLQAVPSASCPLALRLTAYVPGVAYVCLRVALRVWGLTDAWDDVPSPQAIVAVYVVVTVQTS